jgi:menaquinone-9 beta-reductase
MDSCEVLIVGGGPAGSSCAWALRHSGLDVAIFDKQVFPRDKVCGGWITPGVLKALDIDASEYGRNHVLQAITSFRTGCIGSDSELETEYGSTVSYGIRRREFDDYLLRRCGARVCQGVTLSTLIRSGASWIANGNMRAGLVIGAGGHFCQVARLLSGSHTGVPVAAQETEFEMDADQIAACDVRGSCPELYFCPDMKGYGWCFRKQNFLNIGLGRADPHGLAEQVRSFVRVLAERGRVPFEVPPLKGHAYLLYGTPRRQIAGDGFLLIGDSAGLARAQSGEGILPAIESGLLAADVIRAADGNYEEARMARYKSRLAERLGSARESWTMRIGRSLPSQFTRFAAGYLLDNSWFCRHVVLDGWFLHG